MDASGPEDGVLTCETCGGMREVVVMTPSMHNDVYYSIEFTVSGRRIVATPLCPPGMIYVVACPECNFGPSPFRRDVDDERRLV